MVSQKLNIHKTTPHYWEYKFYQARGKEIYLDDFKVSKDIKRINLLQSELIEIKFIAAIFMVSIQYQDLIKI